MKKYSIIAVLVMLSFSLFADGDITKGLKYNPNRESGNVGNAINVFAGLGRVRSSSMGIDLGADLEIQAFIPNLTIGPSAGLGIRSYNYGHWVDGTYYSTTSQLDFFGGASVHYYFDWLIPSMPDEFDVFITNTAGYGMVTYGSGRSSYGYFDFDTHVGGRWNFSEAFSLYAKVGYGRTNVSVGLSSKF